MRNRPWLYQGHGQCRRAGRPLVRGRGAENIGPVPL